MIRLDSPLAEAIGRASATTLRTSHGVNTCRDLLWTFPRRYQDKSELSVISEVEEGQYVTVLARVRSVSERVLAPRKGSGSARTAGPKVAKNPGRMLEAVITDGSTDLRLVFFKGVGFHRTKVRQDAVGLFSGKVSRFRGRLQLAHPECLMAPSGTGEDDLEQVAAFERRVIPIYPATAKVPSWRFDAAVGLVLDGIDLTAGDPVPEPVRRRHGLPDLGQSLRAVHRPVRIEDPPGAMRRLVFEEAFVLQVVLGLRRRLVSGSPARPRPGVVGGVSDALVAGLPYRLTAGQKAAIDEIRTGLAAKVPMQRLLHGEVGAGKTMVALVAMTTVVDAGGQAALLAPTEVLAQQHVQTIREMLGPLGRAGELAGDAAGTQVVLLTGSTGAAERRRVLAQMADGTAGIVVGTHALLSEGVQFADLGLVVVDEQHRFGVEQRAALTRRGADGLRPHLLVMTATPIPRTVAMTVFGDLDVTTLKELPVGRAGVATHVVPDSAWAHHAERAWQRIAEEVAVGHKAYVVCPRIGDAGTTAADAVDAEEVAEEAVGEGSEPDARDVVNTAEHLADGPLRTVRVGVLHGRMSPADKQDVMSRFAADASAPDAVDVLVATTVIEVGVDVPAATVMVIMDADRFGVSQLHQLRGRVGRGQQPGLCLLFTRVDAGSPGAERLQRVAATSDGFRLAQLDLEQRREGDVLGTAQSGRSTTLRVLRAVRDEAVIELAREEAAGVLDADPRLAEHQALRDAVDAWERSTTADYVEKT